MILLDPFDIYFPDPLLLDSDSGLVAMGGDLSPQRLWFAYCLGIFPWSNPDEELLWWCPDPRFVLFPEKLKVSKSMKKILRDNIFTFTENNAFRQVMDACKNASRKAQDGTWITDELIDSFEVLHQHGHAKSFEVWQNKELVGGFYGLKIGNIFCGESMFARVSNASKAAFIHFVEVHPEIKLIDCQIHSPHLESLGAEMISKKEFLQQLKSQVNEY